MKPAFIPLFLAGLITGCAHDAKNRSLSLLRPDQGQSLTDEAWRAFLAAGHENRLALHNMAPLAGDLRQQLRQVIFVAPTNLPPIRVQRPLTGGRAGARGAKLWLGWDTPVTGLRVKTGKPESSSRFQAAESAGWANALPLSNSAGPGPGLDAGGLIAAGYLLYMPVGAIIGAVTGSASAPKEAEVQLALAAVSNSVARFRPHGMLAEHLRNEIQQSDPDFPRNTPIVPSAPSGSAALDVAVESPRLEGGARPDPALWLSLEWSVAFRPNSPAAEYATAGIWQSAEKRTLEEWASNGGDPLERALNEACRQIAAVVARQLAQSP